MVRLGLPRGLQALSKLDLFRLVTCVLIRLGNRLVRVSDFSL